MGALRAPRETAARKAQPGEPPAPAQGNMELIIKNCLTPLCGGKKFAGGVGRGVAQCSTRRPEEMLFPAEAVPRADVKRCLGAPGKDSPTKQIISAH